MPACTVLVIEDDPTLQEYLQAALREVGYEAVVAEGEEALTAAQQHQPTVILLDLMMPLLTGAQLHEQLRANAATARIPIIAMSSPRNLALLVRHLSIDDQLAKPFTLQELYAIVARWAPTPRETV